MMVPTNLSRSTCCLRDGYEVEYIGDSLSGPDDDHHQLSAKSTFVSAPTNGECSGATYSRTRRLEYLSFSACASGCHSVLIYTSTDINIPSSLPTVQ